MVWVWSEYFPLTFWIWTGLHRCMCLSSLAGCALQEGCGTFRGWSLGGSVPSDFRAESHFLCSLCFLPLYTVWPGISHSCCVLPFFSWWTVPFLKLLTKINHFFFKLLLIRFLVPPVIEVVQEAETRSGVTSVRNLTMPFSVNLWNRWQCRMKLGLCPRKA